MPNLLIIKIIIIIKVLRISQVILFLKKFNKNL